MVDANTRKTLSGIPLLQTKAGPRDKELWVQRLKEEYQALIKVNLKKIEICCEIVEIFHVFFCSMFKITKIQARIGSVWNRTKREPNGLEHAGACTICSSMSLKLSLM